VEELIHAGVPVNVTLLFSAQHVRRAVEAAVAGLERRVEAGLPPRVASVASLFISRWDTAAAPRLPAPLQDRTGIAVGRDALREVRALAATPRWQRLAAAGAPLPRLLWASTGTKNPALPEGYYVEALAAPGTINTLPEKTLLAVGAGDSEAAAAGEPFEPAEVLAAVEAAGVDLGALAQQLQADGRDAFRADFRKLLDGLAAKAAALG
jgi:transaldolase